MKSVIKMTSKSQIQLSAVPDVVIDNGYIHYVLLSVSDGKNSKPIIRGYAGHTYEDMVDRVKNELNLKSVECIGGSRLIHSTSCEDVVFCDYPPHSDNYGRVDCEMAKKVILKQLPNYFVNTMTE
ncbi:hypothetical protein CHUAL_008213 [Chamberlinius hualienensis]